MDSKIFYELTKPQQTIWISEQFIKEPLNNVIGTMRFSNDIDIKVLIEAINITVKDNDALRTVLCNHNGHVMQFFDNYTPFEIEVLDLTYETEKNIQKIRNTFYKTKFNMLNHKLYDFIILILPNKKIDFIGRFHHIIADAWSLGFFVDNVAINYSNLALNTNISIPIYSYIDYINREQKYLKSDTYAKNQQFWMDFFTDFTPISLKTTSTSSFVAKKKEFDLSTEYTSNIDNFCKQNGISSYVLFATALNIYFYRSTMQTDVTITTPVLNRVGKEKQTMGMFINMINMKVKNNPDISVLDLLKTVAFDSISLFKNSKFPYTDLISDLRKTKPYLTKKLNNIMFSFQNMRPTKNIEGLVDYSIEWNFNGFNQYELVVNVTDLNNASMYSISYEYLIDLFSETEIDYIHRRILSIINNIISNPSVKLCDINIIDDDEKEKLLETFNNSTFEYDTKLTIVDMFEDVVKSSPNNIAIKFNDIEYSYEDLNNVSNIIANKIESKHISNSKIAIMCDKSFLMVASILGILKSGNCYIPIDPSYPQKRIRYILEDSKVNTIIVSQKYRRNCDGCDMIILDKISSSSKIENINNSSPNKLAYIIYTSGTTGNPKGVMIKHKNIINTLIWRKNTYNFTETDRILQIPSFSFDSSVEDIFTVLISGATLVIPPIFKMDVNIIGDEIKKNKVTSFLVVPSLYKVLLKEKLDCLSSLRLITIAGESFSVSLIKEHFEKLPNVRIINEYGPTENSVCSTYYEFKPNDDKVLIGKPINNCLCYCLDKAQKLLPIGCEGELYVSGPGVSCGYLNKSNITKEKFIENPFNSAYKLYKTGDMVKYDFNGNLEFIERTDNQVKLHGFRIELKEIESAILENSEVKDAIVTIQNLKEDKDILIAYITSDNSFINIQDIYFDLREKLPYYMVPKIMLLDEIPLNPNGKIDRSKLPLPELKLEKSVQPENTLEKTILSICQEVLENNNIGVLDDLFVSANADSLSILTISSKLFNLGIKIGIQDFYKYTTVRDLANMHHNLATSTHSENIIEPFITPEPNFNVDKIKFHYKNILLTGATGFLGIHILDKLLKNTDCNVYCIIREKYNQPTEKRLQNLLTYYFDDSYYNTYKHRIFLITGELSQENFGLDIDVYKNLQNKVTCIINCVANIKHYGNYSSFKKTNVTTVQNLIKFAKSANIVLNHISTTTVSGNYLVDDSIKCNFTENHLYIGQNYESNVYVHSKFDAERLIIEAEHSGLKANIFRLGNLMGRYSDGKFQKNKLDNAYYTRLLAFAKIKHLPNELKNQLLEFSPIDNVAEAIVALLKINNLNNSIFHVFSNSLIKISTLLNAFRNFNIECDFTTYENFLEQLNNPENEKCLKYIVNDLNRKNGFSSSITIDSTLTQKYLDKLGFKWSKINEDYLNRFFTSSNFTEDLDL